MTTAKEHPRRRRLAGGLTAAILVAAAALLPGCLLAPLQALVGTPGGDPRYVVSVHEFADSGVPLGQLGGALPTVDRNTVRVKVRPLISSRFFAEVTRVTAADGAPVLEAALDDYGRMVWLQTCAEHAGRRLAVAMDGVYLFDMTIPSPGAGDPVLRIPGPWSPSDLDRIVEWAPKNYKKLNQ